MRSCCPIVLTISLGFFASSPAHAGPRAASKTFDAPAFSLSAKELRAAAAHTHEEKDAPVVVLYDEASYRILDGQVVEQRYRRVYQVIDQEGIEGWDELKTGWAPWYQSKPSIRARVLTSSNQFIDLDSKTIETPQVKQGDAHTYSDWRSLRAPLPAVHAGSLVETEVVIPQHGSFGPGGDRYSFSIGDYVPVLQSRVAIEYSSNTAPTIRSAMLSGLQTTKSRQGKMTRQVFDLGRTAGFEIEEYMPSRLPRVGYVAFSTSKSWSALSTRYEHTIAASIAGGALPAEARSPEGKSREETIALALALLQKRVRYTGLEFGKNAIEPWSPETTWQRQYGDCKDKATLLVAMLEAHDIEAHVALLRTGYGFDDGKRLPGLHDFDHAIVYVPGLGKNDPATWIDPTVELARPGQLSGSVQGRWALVARKGQNKLIKIPVEHASRNAIAETRTIVLASRGPASLVEKSLYSGKQEIGARYEYRSESESDLKKTFAKYIGEHYAGKEVSRVVSSRADDLSASFEQAIHVDAIHTAFSNIGQATVNLNYYQLASLLPEELMSYVNKGTDERTKSAARKNPMAIVPTQKIWNYEIHLPNNLVPTVPLEAEKKSFGPILFEKRFALEGEQLSLHLSFRVDGEEMSASEVNQCRKELAAFLDESALSLSFANKAISLSNEGRHVDAASEIRAQRKLAPKDAALAAFEALVLNGAGLGKEARRVAAEATKLDPSSTTAHEVQAMVAMHDVFGRFMAKGYQRDLSIAALKKAIALSPDLDFLYARLGVVQSRGVDGMEASGDHGASIATLQEAHKRGATNFDSVLGRLLLGVGRIDELHALIAKHKGQSEFESLRLTALARQKPGALKAAAKKADASTLQRAFQIALLLQDYKSAGALAPFSQAKNMQGAKLLGDTVVRFRHNPSAKEPVEIVKEGLAYILELDSAGLAKVLAKRGRRYGFSEAEVLRQTFLGAAPEEAREVLRSIVVDLWVGVADLVEDGRAGAVRRIVARFMGVNTHIYAFTVWDGRKHRLLASSFEPGALASEAISLARHKRVKEAKTIVEWLIELQRRTPQLTAGQSPETIWKADSIKEVQRILLTAALFIRTPVEAKLAADIFKSCPLGTSDEVGQICLKAGAASLLLAKDFDGALSLLDQVGLRWPKLRDESRGVKAIYLAAAKRYDQLDKIVAEGVAEDDERQSFYALQKTFVLLGRSQFADAFDVFAKLAADGELPHEALNNAAWNGLFVEGKGKESLAMIERALLSAGNDEKVNGLHTQATLWAQNGEVGEAMASLGASISLRRDESIHSSDWLVYGKIAEALGRTSAAIEAYGIVIDHVEDFPFNWSSTTLARRWRSALQASN